MATDTWGLSWKGTAGAWLSSWASAFVPPPPVVEGQKPAGRSRKRYLVEIDGQDFPVDSPAHATALLERAREIAVEHAQRLAAVAVPHATKIGRKPIPLPTPSIRSPDAELNGVIREAHQKFNELYRSAAIDAELAHLMQRAIDDDEDDALLLLM